MFTLTGGTQTPSLNGIHSLLQPTRLHLMSDSSGHLLVFETHPFLGFHAVLSPLFLFHLSDHPTQATLKKKLFIWLCQVLAAACGIQFPVQGSNLGPLLWEHRVLATGPPGKSPEFRLLFSYLSPTVGVFSTFFITLHTFSAHLLPQGYFSAGEPLQNVPSLCRQVFTGYYPCAS